ncbi:MAG: hypothetical protein HC780_07050 [Leptolyngbyaceae cyanobacterium CSU_1_3]|nr:hypothetical protein [Leptolyngbyaceae cyanobacterium CSU_1_3]
MPPRSPSTMAPKTHRSAAKAGGLSVPPGATQTVSAGTTTLNTTANNALQAGYAITAPAAFALNRTRGYTLGFNVQLLSEDHSSNDRAGFSVIALGSDKRGIELGLWTNSTQKTGSIWAQTTA